MHQSNIIVHKCLDKVAEIIEPGISTIEINNAIEQLILSHKGATPEFKGYSGYKHASCISVNEIVVHGIPDNRIITDSDIVSVDVGVRLNGFVGDAARTYCMPNTSPRAVSLSKHTYQSLVAGTKACVPGNRLYDIAVAIDAVAKEHKYGNLKGFSGHGIGAKMHEPPSVFNYINKNEDNIVLREGMCLALEPMMTLGSANSVILPDGWGVKTDDSSLSAHWEWSLAITADGSKILGKTEDILDDHN